MSERLLETGKVVSSFASMATGASGDIELEKKVLSKLQKVFEDWCREHRDYMTRWSHLVPVKPLKDFYGER